MYKINVHRLRAGVLLGSASPDFSLPLPLQPQLDGWARPIFSVSGAEVLG